MLPSPRNYEVDYEVIQRFFSLDQAVEIAIEWKQGWFPLFDTDGIVFWIVGLEDKQRTAPIYSNDDLGLPDEPRYQSLTEMMSTIVIGVKEALSNG